MTNNGMTLLEQAKTVHNSNISATIDNSGNDEMQCVNQNNACVTSSTRFYERMSTLNAKQPPRSLPHHPPPPEPRRLKPGTSVANYLRAAARHKKLDQSTSTIAANTNLQLQEAAASARTTTAGTTPSQAGQLGCIVPKTTVDFRRAPEFLTNDI